MGLRTLIWPVAAGLALGMATARAEEAPQFALPLVCEPHKTCFIQNYVDVDPGQGVKDYACGQATNDGHSGVDFRLLSAEAAKAGVAVLAAADGTIKALRDGVDDVFYKPADRQAIAGRECGNGIIIDHGAGWETQYCHMKRGSIRVTKGQAVKKGDKLGEVGYSGMASFAHVHLTVRHDGKSTDPFLPSAAAGSCDKNAKGPGLWEPSVAASFPYKNGEIISAGFSGAPPDYNALEADHRSVEAVTPASAAFLVYGRFVNLLAGDRIHIVASGPAGPIVDEVTKPVDHHKASYVAYAGKKRGTDPWPTGAYTGRIELVRDGGVVATSNVSLELK